MVKGFHSRLGIQQESPVTKKLEIDHRTGATIEGNVGLLDKKKNQPKNTKTEKLPKQNNTGHCMWARF